MGAIGFYAVANSLVVYLMEFTIAIAAVVAPMTTKLNTEGRVPELREITARPTLTTRLRNSSGDKMPTFRDWKIFSSLTSRPAQRSWPRAFRRLSNRHHAQSG